jgi:DNA-binding GntR family transcriptional regulator
MSLRSQEAYDQLRQMIRAGLLSAEEPLSERSLSTRLGFGRMPVREALKLLERDGLIAVIPGRGTFVKTLTLDEVRELYEVRIGMEGIAAYLAAQRGPTPELRALEPVFEAQLRDEGAAIPDIQETGKRLHNAIFVASENRLLIKLYDDLRDQIALTIRMTREDHHRVRETIGEHQGILRAVLAGDADRAQKAIYQHLSNALAARVRIFSRFDIGNRQPGAPSTSRDKIPAG